MRVAALNYSHRFGSDAIVVRLKDTRTDLPKITNRLLNRILGYPCAELGREDEWAEWGSIMEVKDLPEV